MGLLKLGFLGFDDLIFVVIFIVVLFAFLREFKLTSRSSWALLFGLGALGGFFFWQTWRRKKLLEELARREKALEQLEERYEQLKNNAEISEQAYLKAKEELERSRVEAGLAILRADAELAKKVEDLQREFQDMTAEESVKKIREALAGN